MGFAVVVRPTGMGQNGDLGRLDRMPFWPLWRAGDAPTRRHILDTIRRADAFVSLNREMAAELCSRGFPPERIVQIASGVSVDSAIQGPEAKRAIRERLGLPAGPILLFVGRLNEHKGAGRLLRILPRLLARHADLTLVLLGDGPQRRELEGLGEKLGVSSHVRWLGERPDPEEVFRAADVFALPTQGEGMSNALLEAMAAGLPCVATRVSGNVEALTDEESGLLVKLDDPGGLTEAIGRLLDDGALCARMGRMAQARVRTHFSEERMVEAYRGLYYRLVSGTKGPEETWRR